MGAALVYSKHGVVASEEPHASRIGASVLEAGGNAVDAAVATSMTLAVTVPHLGGLGGDFFALIREPEGKVWFINGSGAAPRLLTRELVESRGYEYMPRGPLSPTVPGLVDGLYLMWRKQGSAEWRRLIMPAAKLASNGFPASRTLARAVEKNRSLLERDEGSRKTYLEAPPREGGVFRLPGLGELLRIIAEDPRSFYEDKPAELMADYVSRVGGVLSKEDLAGHKGFEDKPLSAEYKGWKLWETPPNTQGASTLQLLLLMGEEPLPDPESPSRVEQLLRLAPPLYEWRDRNIGDPEAMRISREELVSPRTISEIKGLRYTGCRGMSREGDTTFFTVVDSEGRIVAGIQSLFHHFGSLVTEPVFQVTLNDRALGFTLKPGRPSTLKPGRRPLHTLSALIMEHPGGEVFALGASAGHLRPQLYAWMASNIMDYGMSLLEAISHPRAAWDPETCILLAERSVVVPSNTVVRLRDTIGVASASSWRSGVAVGATDPRGAGIPSPAIRI